MKRLSVDLVNEVLNLKDLDVNTVDEYGNTALHSLMEEFLVKGFKYRYMAPCVAAIIEAVGTLRPEFDFNRKNNDGETI